VLATDLLVGIAIGIGVKVVIHIIHGAPLPSLFRLKVDVLRGNKDGLRVAVKDSAVFSTWIGLKKRLERLKGEPVVVVDLSDTLLVDHTVMQKLNELASEFKEAGSSLVIGGLEQHRRLSNHPTAARQKRANAVVRRAGNAPSSSGCRNYDCESEEEREA
jgi:MFS superfamily sulfate permease-like transporter